MPRDGLRLHDALGADAQRVELAAPHVAHDQKAQHLLEVVGARIELVVRDGAERAGALRASVRGCRCIDAAGVDRDRDHRTAVLLGNPRHEERGVEAAGVGEHDGRGARGVGGGGHRHSGKSARRRAISSSWARALAVAMKMVSSPEMVPATSGHSALSIATATLCAAPMVVRSTVSEGPARRSAAHELRQRAEIPVGAAHLIRRQHVAAPRFEDTQIAQVAADGGLGRLQAGLLQQAYQVLLPPHLPRAQDAHDGAAPLQLVCIAQHGSLNTSSGLYA